MRSLLIEKYADINAVITLGGQTVLHAAIGIGRKYR